MPSHAGEPSPQATEETRKAITGLLDAFKQGDSKRLADYYDDNVDWLFYAPHAVFPFGGSRRGKAEVLKGFATLYRDFNFSEYIVEAVVVDGERVATLSNANMTQRATGRIIRVRTANFYRFRNGKVIEYRGFTDSFDMVEQVRGREFNI